MMNPNPSTSALKGSRKYTQNEKYVYQNADTESNAKDKKQYRIYSVSLSMPSRG